ncbi:MAG: hypothetical protein QM541_07635 [Flavobacterium sp.]|nr:hypothetical protein [Flavobacterium sp.]
MLPKQLHKNIIIKWYCLLFYALLLFKFFNSKLLFQIQPAFFTVKLDIVTYLLLLLNPHGVVLNNPTVWLVLDVCFYSMPLVYFLTNKFKQEFVTVAAIIMLVINLLYIQLYILYSLDSIEMQIAWLLFPVIFLTKKESSFYLLANGLRYYFLFLFTSAAVWKFTQHGLFNVQQLSNILLIQHKEILTANVTVYQNFMYWLTHHSNISYSLYVAATLLELMFIIGFFTKKYDWLLAIATITFIVLDYLIMRIIYIDWLPFLLLLFYKPTTK